MSVTEVNDGGFRAAIFGSVIDCRVRSRFLVMMMEGFGRFEWFQQWFTGG